MNIFLTGERQIGKTTAIKRFLEKTGIKPRGFTSSLNRSTGDLFITIYGKDGGERIKVASRHIDGMPPQPDIIAFDRVGEKLLSIDMTGCELLIMDEVGFLERNAVIFRHAVEELLEKGIPAVGVIRNKKDGPFWELISGHSGTRVVTVTEDNRDDIPALLEEVLE